MDWDPFSGGTLIFDLAGYRRARQAPAKVDDIRTYGYPSLANYFMAFLALRAKTASEADTKDLVEFYEWLKVRIDSPLSTDTKHHLAQFFELMVSLGKP